MNPVAPIGPYRAALVRRQWRRWYAAAFLAGAALVMLTVPLWGQQSPTPPDRPLILWGPPPEIGTDSANVDTVDEQLPLLASAEWPEFTDTIIRSLTKCTGLKPPHDWKVRTVQSPVFTVGIWWGGQWYRGQAFIGYTFRTSHQIFVAQPGLRSPPLLRHELLHAILTDNGLNADHGTPVADAYFKHCAPRAE